MTASASLLWSGLALALLMLLVIAAMVFLMPRLGRRYRLEPRRVTCPADGRQALVDFMFRSENGTFPVDVFRCSLRPGEVPVACGRECRSVSVAPFAMRSAAG